MRAWFDAELGGLFARYDLTAADFTVIAALRRAGAPHRLPQSVLMDRLGLTSGTVSVRLTRLENKGVVERTPSPDDGRGTIVTLTGRGLELFDEVAPVHLHNEDVLLSALTDGQRDQLVDLLRILVVAIEHPHPASPLGMTVAPAHVARRMRTAVGLSDTPGLLVTEVDPGTPAARADLRAGDLLVAVDGTELRSWVTLAAHHARCADDGLTLSVLRGGEPFETTIAAAAPG